MTKKQKNKTKKTKQIFTENKNFKAAKKPTILLKLITSLHHSKHSFSKSKVKKKLQQK